jgi:hypothetical protein
MKRFQSAYGSVSESNVTVETAQQLVDQKLSAPPSSSSDYVQYIDYFNKSADGLNQVLFGKDPRVAAAIKGAMVKNLEISVKKNGNIPIIGPYLKAKYRTTLAEYKALTAQASTADVSDTLNLALKAGGLVVGVAFLGLVFSQIALSRARTRAVSAGY